MEVILAQHSPHLLPREICHRVQYHPSTTTYLSPVHVPAGFQKGRCQGWRRSKGRREVEVLAFWKNLSKPTSVEMESITDTDQLDDILRKSQEDDNRAIVVDWMAAWCRKCIYLKPKMEKLAADFPKVKFYCVDVNNVSQALVKRGNISKMPTIQLWKEREMKAEVIGGHKAWLVMEEVREMIQKHS